MEEEAGDVDVALPVLRLWDQRGGPAERGGDAEALEDEGAGAEGEGFEREGFFAEGVDDGAETGVGWG